MTMPGLVLEAAISACLVVGSAFALIASIGLVRLPDSLMRLHAPTVATTAGVGGVLAASLLYFGGTGRFGLHELLIVLFIFLTTPASALMIARALIRRVRPSAPDGPHGS